MAHLVCAIDETCVSILGIEELSIGHSKGICIFFLIFCMSPAARFRVLGCEGKIPSLEGGIVVHVLEFNPKSNTCACAAIGSNLWTK